jgi:hypothetical protein
LVADFKNIKKIKPVARTASRIKVFKLQVKEIREEYQNKIKGKILKNETGAVEER